jgi:hypothetical protein
MGYFGVILSFIYDYFFFDESISYMTIFGFILIFTAAYNLVSKKS